MSTGPFLHLVLGEPLEQRANRIAKNIKFGIAGTDMPGHEYMPDDEIASLSYLLASTPRQCKNKNLHEPSRGPVQ